MKYSDMWMHQDTDGQWCIIFIREGSGHTEIKPFTFKTQESAQSYINSVMREV